MKVVRELFAGAVDGNGAGSRKTEAMVGGVGAVTMWPEQAWPIAVICGAFLLARGYQDAMAAAASPRDE